MNRRADLRPRRGRNKGNPTLQRGVAAKSVSTSEMLNKDKCINIYVTSRAVHTNSYPADRGVGFVVSLSLPGYTLSISWVADVISYCVASPTLKRGGSLRTMSPTSVNTSSEYGLFTRANLSILLSGAYK
ncbi:MAG: hypothetical protein LUC22_01270 [Prevotella sp.]|nr:hypothetical protein [Prevotella sp.]